MVIILAAILLTSFLVPVFSAGSVYQLMKEISTFTDSDIYTFFEIFGPYGSGNIDIVQYTNPSLHLKIRAFNYKYDRLNYVGQDFIRELVRLAVEEHRRRLSSYIAWESLRNQFRSLDPTLCMDLTAFFAALDKLGSCGTMSAPVKQPRPRFYVRSLRATVPNYYSELAIARHHLISAQEILGKKGNETAWNITGRNRDISEAVRYLNPEPFSNMRNALKHIQRALSAPNGAKRTDSSIHTRHVTLDLIKAAHILMRAISKNSLPIAKEMKEVETILEDLQTTYFGYEHERKRAENSIEKALEKLRGKIH
ncbi:hypothetical protein RB195_011576 [Necator americanus]|uniref:Uncharacterized protein n=1 Tax=Necator americanus TaxID=51031 RepID=A0ABR1D3Z4_NECAM